MAQLPPIPVSSSSPKPEPSSDPVGQHADSAYKILVVEDEVLIRMDLVEMLEELGHRAIEAGSGEEAVRLAESETFDILLTDLGLPKMTGEQLAAALRARSAALGVIFATGNNSAPDIPIGAPPVLLRKPYDRQGLEQAVAAAARR